MLGHMTVEFQNRMTSLRKLWPGLPTYMTARSSFWMVHLRDPTEWRYIVRSTKEASRLDAMAAANEFAVSFFKKMNSDQAGKATTRCSAPMANLAHNASFHS